MQKIAIGQLRVLTYSHIYTFPNISEPGNDMNPSKTNLRPDLKAELRVVNDAFWVRLCAMGDLGFSEAYMYGDVECDDLVGLFQVCQSLSCPKLSFRQKSLKHSIPAILGEQRKSVKYGFIHLVLVHAATKNHFVPLP